MKNPTQALAESALAIDGPGGWFEQICEAAGEMCAAHGGTEEEIAAARQLQAEMLEDVMPLLRALVANVVPKHHRTVH
jgi:hypothetical protein